jgi:outer membrane protein assembly factor BamB
MVPQITSLDALEPVIGAAIGEAMPAAAPLETAAPATPPAATAPAAPAARTRPAARRRRAVTNPRVLRQAPVLWRFASGRGAFGIFINERQCWLGNQDGHIFALSHSGAVEEQVSLPRGVKCLVADDAWIYAGCDDGKVYDLSGKIPRVAYELAENEHIYWLDIYDGYLAVSDAGGRVALMNPEDEVEWLQTTGNRAGWMVRCDERGVFHGHSNGVSMYEKQQGRLQWHEQTARNVLFGWQEGDMLYAATAQNRIYGLTKQGQCRTIYECDAPMYSCATAPEGRYVFAADNNNAAYCFAANGQRLWKLTTGCGSALSMQFFNDRLYIVTTQGYLACIDVSEAAIQDAQQGYIPEAVQVQAPAAAAVRLSTTLEATSDASSGVVLECVREGSKLRVHAISPGFQANFRVQFPRNIRQEGMRYVVDEVRLSARGNFYRAYGNIKRLVDAAEA